MKFNIVFGSIKKSYTITTANINNKLEKFIQENTYFKGKLFKNRFHLKSIESYSMRGHKYPIYNIQGTIISDNQTIKIEVKINSWNEELIAILMLLMTFISASISLYDTYNPFLARKGEYFDVGLIVLFIIGFWRFDIARRNKQKGLQDFETFINQLEQSKDN